MSEAGTWTASQVSDWLFQSLQLSGEQWAREPELSWEEFRPRLLQALGVATDTDNTAVWRVFQYLDTLSAGEVRDLLQDQDRIAELATGVASEYEAEYAAAGAGASEQPAADQVEPVWDESSQRWLAWDPSALQWISMQGESETVEAEAYDAPVETAAEEALAEAGAANVMDLAWVTDEQRVYLDDLWEARGDWHEWLPEELTDRLGPEWTGWSAEALADRLSTIVGLLVVPSDAVAEADRLVENVTAQLLEAGLEEDLALLSPEELEEIWAEAAEELQQ